MSATQADTKGPNVPVFRQLDTANMKINKKGWSLLSSNTGKPVSFGVFLRI